MTEVAPVKGALVNTCSLLYPGLCSAKLLKQRGEKLGDGGSLAFSPTPLPYFSLAVFRAASLLTDACLSRRTVVCLVISFYPSFSSFEIKGGVIKIIRKPKQQHV